MTCGRTSCSGFRSPTVRWHGVTSWTPPGQSKNRLRKAVPSSWSAAASVPSSRWICGTTPGCAAPRCAPHTDPPPSRSARRLLSALLHEVGEPPNSGYIDRNAIAGQESELIRRNDAGAGEKDGTVRKAVLLTQPMGQLCERALHRRQRSRAVKYRGSTALDDHANGDLIQGRHRLGQCNDRAEGTGMIIDLGLRQVERVLPLDVAGTHIFSDRVADDL